MVNLEANPCANSKPSALLADAVPLELSGYLSIAIGFRGYISNLWAFTIFYTYLSHLIPLKVETSFSAPTETPRFFLHVGALHHKKTWLAGLFDGRAQLTGDFGVAKKTQGI